MTQNTVEQPKEVMRIVTYEYKSSVSGDRYLNTTLIDIPLIDWWQLKMEENYKNANKLVAGSRPAYYETTAIVFSQEIPVGDYPDIEWYSKKESK